MSSNNTTFEYSIIEHKLALYKIFIPPMLIFCLTSVIINIRVLLSVHWIRRPLSPTLYISLSLAAADACTSALLGTGLFLNSYLPMVWDINSSCMIIYIFEIFRLSGIIITVFHLLALSVNHYLGILKPLHYVSIMTTRKVTILVVLLWLIPISLHVTYFLTVPDQTYWFECTKAFTSEMDFRYRFTSLFFIPIIIMAFCYTHILIIVRNQQKKWAQLSRSGSTRTRGVRNSCQQKKTLDGNVKAIYTTLLILGSCIIGWLPACLAFVLICDNGCVFTLRNINTIFFMSWFINNLIILKTLVNPIIYSARMIEIQVHLHA